MKNKDLIDFGAGDILLESLASEGIIEESKMKLERSLVLLNENVVGSPANYTYKGRTFSWEVFKAAYTEYDLYPDYEDVWQALGFSRLDFMPGEGTQQTPEANMSTAMRRTVRHFMANNKEAKEILAWPFKNRKQAYSEHFAGRRGEEVDEDEIFNPYAEKPTVDQAIEPGRKNRRNKSTQIIDRINSQDLMPGEFYSDFTRIPKTRWGSWLRWWEREVSSVKNDRSMFGRPWRKHFVLGYQMAKNLYYEIWYNSIDSTFTIHDQRGNAQTRKYSSLSEAIKGIFNAAAQASSRDSEVFTSMNNQLALSVGRAMTNGLDSFMDDVQRLEKREWEKTNKARKEAERDREEKAKKDAADKAKAKAELRAFRDKNLKKGKELAKKTGRSIADTMVSVADTLKTQGKSASIAFGNRAADASLRAFVSGSISLEAFMKQVAGAYDIVGTPEEKNIRAGVLEGDIDLSDYILGIRSLYARNKAAEDRANSDKEKEVRRAQEISKNYGDSTVTNRSYADRTFNRSLTESMEFLLENLSAYETQEDLVDDVVDKRSHESAIKAIRKEASGKMTQNIIKNSVNADLIEVYEETKVNKSEFHRNSVRWFNSGRSDPIVLPSDKRPLWNRIKMFFSGQRYQAEFIVGFSLSKAVNIEVWYVTEPNPEYSLKDFGDGTYRTNPVIGSFYIFDISSGRLIRKYIPYYRNAVQIVMAKISAI